MLNNEIQCLNTEKEELEKKLSSVSSKRIKTPCVAIQEEDEEEPDSMPATYNESDNNNHRLETIEEYTPNIDSSYSGKLITKESEMNELFDFNEKIQTLQKQVEEMTFYADELKSDLEAEREKNNEFLSEIDDSRKRIESLEQEKKSYEKEQNAEIANSDNGSSQQNDEEITRYCREFEQRKNLNSIKELLTQHSENDLIKRINNTVSLIIQQFEVDIQSKEASLKDETEKKKHFESQLEKVIANFKEEIETLESRLKEKKNELEEFKTQVSFFLNSRDLTILD
jgi:chromosome segregation ATPase